MSKFIPRRLLGATAAAALATVALASPVHADPPRIDHVNLGDSFSAGIGSGGLSVAGPECIQGSGPDHVSRLDDLGRIHLLEDSACAGFDTSLVGQTATKLADKLGDAELVTLTLGGNDLPWGQVFAACSAQGSPDACASMTAALPAQIRAAGVSAKAALETIDSLTDGQVVVLGYPHLVDGTHGSPLFPADTAEHLNELTDYLNAQLAQAAAETGADFVDVTERFAGHGADSPNPWIHLDPVNPASPDNLHPTTRGYLSGYFPAAMEAISLGRPR
jgi:lysophospholipase L1-like esterase